MNRPPEIHKVLVLSTSHLPQETLNNLDCWSGVVVYPNEYGAFVWVPNQRDSELVSLNRLGPDELLAVYHYARQLDCKYVKFDRDGPEVDNLPIYEWSELL